MAKHQVSKHARPVKKKWSERLYDGRLRAQCRTCFEAGLTASQTVRLCPVCAVRSARRRAEAEQFRAFVATGVGAQGTTAVDDGLDG